ncbi:MAG: RHS repeat-associated core domain-containing protein, partial [Elusimicrobiota bacterium]|nr:RHS repeat-associated core domain-containing protein [Elusimicrobiota bacterium]
LGQTKTSTYDDKGNLVQTTNARGQTISYAYDSRDRLVTKTLPEGTVSYEYDAVGNLTKVTNYNGSIVETSYDALNRVTQSKQTLPGGYQATIGYGYDANGNRTSMTTPWGSFSYLYDSLNRLTRITNPQSRQFNFQYNANGRRTKLIYPNGIETTYAYDNAGQVLSIIHTRTSDSTVIAKSTYSYDSAGNRLSMTDLAGTHSYGYDDQHRLTTASHPAASVLEVKNETFTYDAAGNRLADTNIAGYTYDDANRLIENNSFTYTFDADGNRTRTQDKLTSAATNFSFSSENQLVGATRPNSESWTYKYDRIERRIEKSSGTAASQKSRFIYNGDSLLAELDGDNTARQVFTMTLNANEPLGSRSTAGEERFFHGDALGSVRALASMSASAIESYEYEAYGRATIKTPAGVISPENSENRILFSAEFFDFETSMQLHGYRFYDVAVGSFNSEDPIGIGGGKNFYTYVSNNPVNWVDPDGLAKCTYSIGSGRLSCTSNDNSSTAEAQMFSGVGTSRNNPADTGIENIGPVPAGNYRISKLAGKNPRDWFLDPGLLLRIGYRFKVNRGGFNLHLRKGGSLGCITADRDELDINLIELNDILNLDKGNNTIEVKP